MVCFHPKLSLDVLHHKWLAPQNVQMKPNHFDGRLWLRHFKLFIITFEILCNETNPLVSPVIYSHPLRKSHQSFFCFFFGFVLRDLFGKFVSIVVYLSDKKRTTTDSVIISIRRFLMLYIPCRFTMKLIVNLHGEVFRALAIPDFFFLWKCLDFANKKITKQQ